MIVAIAVMTTLTMLNTFMIFVMLLSIYGKANDIIEYKERQSEIITKVVNGVIDYLKSKDKK